MSEDDGTDTEEQAEQLMDEAMKLVEEALRLRGKKGKFEDFEEEVMKEGNELLRRILERELQRRSDSLPEHAWVKRCTYSWPDTGMPYRRRQAGVGTYFTLCGPIRVTRNRYRSERKPGFSLVLLEEVEGLIEQMTPAMARCLAQGYANQPLRTFREDLISAHRCPPSRATMERKAKAIGDAIGRSVSAYEAMVREEEEVPSEAARIVVGLDRTSVPMEETLRDAGPPPPRNKPRQRRAPPPVHVQWRMDYVGTVAVLDAAGEVLTTRYFRAASKDPSDDIARRIADEVQDLLAKRADLQVTIVQDGATELWNALGAALRKREVSWDEVLDWYHVAERLHECTELAFQNVDRRAPARERWQRWLLHEDDGPRRLGLALRRAEAKASGDTAQALRQHRRYFAKRAAQMDYPRAREIGAPIGSGITEGACKSLIGARAKRSGQRWRPRGLAAALALRAFRQSQRFDAVWSHFLSERKAYRWGPHPLLD